MINQRQDPALIRNFVFIAGINDTGDKLLTGVNDTSDK
jgi:hypothetical protein